MSKLHQRQTSPPWSQRRRLAVLVTLGVLALATALSISHDVAPSTNERAAPAAPELFGAASVCPDEPNAIERARRFEELGLLRADRYPYDPRDGVRAVEHYQAAESCYRLAGASDDARRARQAEANLVLTVNTDYAAARLSFANALESERWLAALTEVRRLLRLTEHLGEHEYVEWLKKNVGRLAVRARKTS